MSRQRRSRPTGSGRGSRGGLLLSIAIVGLAWFCWRGLSHGPELERPFASAMVTPTRSTELSRQRPELAPISADRENEETPLTGRVVSASGRPIADASVCVAPASERCCATATCVTSDPSGHFTLDLPLAGSADLFVSAPGYLPLRHGVLQAELGSPRLLVLQPGGARISGRVVDAFGGPVARAVLTTRADGESQRIVGMTDASGNFGLSVLPGTTLLLAEADGYSQVQRYIDAPADDVQLVMVAAASLSGQVLAEETREPIAGVDVEVVNPRWTTAGPHTVSTDREGAFHIDALPAGAYRIMARSDTWRGDERWIALDVADRQSIEILVRPASHLKGIVEVNGSRCTEGVVTVEGPVSDARTIDAKGQVDFRALPPGTYDAVIRCARGLQLSERIELELGSTSHTWRLEGGLTLTGLATTSSGGPLAGARIVVSPTDPLGERPSASCISESSGEFSCSGLLPGDYECQLRSDSAEMSDSVEVSISAESSPRVLLRSYPSATLRVMVDADSKLQLGAISVFAKRKGSAPLLARQAGGAFVFDPLPLGSYDVSLDPAVPGAALRVEVARPGEVLEVRLAGISSRTLTGRVIDERGQGVSDAWVRVAGDSPNSQARPAAPVLTDPQGEFTVEGLLPGRYRVDANSARGEGLLSDALAGESVTVTLRTFGSLSGTVSTANGAPVPRFIVAYSQSNGEASGRVSGFNGSWSLPWLAPGTYELEATAPEGTASGTVEVSPGGRAAMALSLRANEPGENSSATARR